MLMIDGLMVLGLGMVAAAAFPSVRYRRVGGLRFLRVGRLQASFCVVRREG